MPVVICFVNMKGGVGKTTLCVNLAFEIFSRRKKVLIVDNDPQFSATSALLRPQFYIDRYITKRDYLTIYDIYENPPRIRGTKQEKNDPQQFFMTPWYMKSEPEIVLDLIASRIELYETLRNPSHKEYCLAKFLEKYAKKYDYIFIDCPPTPSVLTYSAFAASDYAIIPVTPNYFSTMGLPQFLGTLTDFKERLHDPKEISPLGVVFTNVERQITSETSRAMDRVRHALKEDYPDEIPVFEAKMSHFKVYEKTLWQSVPVQKISGPGTRGKSHAVFELRCIADEMDRNIALRKGR